MFGLVYTGRGVTYSIVCLFTCALTVFSCWARCPTLTASIFIWERKEVEVGGGGGGGGLGEGGNLDEFCPIHGV